MEFRRVHRDIQLPCNLFVGCSGNELTQDFRFTHGQFWRCSLFVVLILQRGRKLDGRVRAGETMGDCLNRNAQLRCAE